MRIVCFFSLLMMHFSLNAQTASFNITYTGTSNQVEQAINKAADIWSNILISNVPIKLNITWGDASSLGVLGITISNGIKDFPNAPYSNVWYPSCLADAFAGYDLQPSDTDMDIFLDSSTDWYFGLDGNCPFWQHDLVSCALHEIGHGLGFPCDAWECFERFDGILAGGRNEEHLPATGDFYAHGIHGA